MAWWGQVLSFARGVTQIGVSFGLLALLGLYTYQLKLIYPAGLNEGHGRCLTPDEYDMDYELVHLVTADEETLQCYSLKHDPKNPSYTNKTVVILSPNAGNIGHALPIVSILYRQFNYNVFIYSYRGYGKSLGKPLEKGLKLDAQRVIKYLTTEDEQFATSLLILYGRSLGTAVSIYMASSMPQSILAIILENGFLLIPKTVPHIFPFLKYFTSFVHQIWDLERLIEKIPGNIPVLFLLARQDEIIPPSHMDILYQKSKSTDKAIHYFENSSHNDTVVQEHYWEYVHEFIRQKAKPIGY